MLFFFWKELVKLSLVFALMYYQCISNFVEIPNAVLQPFVSAKETQEGETYNHIKNNIITFVSLRQSLYILQVTQFFPSAGTSENIVLWASNRTAASINHLCCFIWRQNRRAKYHLALTSASYMLWFPSERDPPFRCFSAQALIGNRCKVLS